MIKNKLIIFLGIVVVFLIGYSAVLINKNKSLNKDVELSNNNISAYKGIINKSAKENAILRLDIKQMKESGDSMIMSLEKKIKSVESKNKQATHASSTAITIRDSFYIPQVIDRYLKIDTVIIKDHFNKATIKADSTGILFIPESSDNISFIYYIEKDYKIKPFFKRLIKFNFKKYETLKYKLENQNKSVRIDSVRVVKLEN